MLTALRERRHRPLHSNAPAQLIVASDVVTPGRDLAEVCPPEPNVLRPPHRSRFLSHVLPVLPRSLPRILHRAARDEATCSWCYFCPMATADV